MLCIFWLLHQRDMLFVLPYCLVATYIYWYEIISFVCIPSIQRILGYEECCTKPSVFKEFRFALGWQWEQFFLSIPNYVHTFNLRSSKPEECLYNNMRNSSRSCILKLAVVCRLRFGVAVNIMWHVPRNETNAKRQQLSRAAHKYLAPT